MSASHVVPRSRLYNGAMFRIAPGLCLALALHAQTLPPAATSKVDFAHDIQPLLEKRCLVCHGPQQQMKGLRFDQKESAQRTIQPGKSSESLLIRMVSGLEPKVMPPVGSRLTAAEIGLLRAWIDQGAVWPAQGLAIHWSFQKIRRPDPPQVKDRAWPRNAIDDFVL